MKANNTHISLETAKLLKDCGVESKYYWSEQLQKLISKKQFLSYDPYNEDNLQDDGFRQAVDTTYPAYTWQEILWEYPQEFFGEDAYDTFGGYCHTCRFAVDILDFLQDKEYDQADKYFRDNCILIK